MPAPTSPTYYAILDLLDKTRTDSAALQFYEGVTFGAISEQEFRLLLNRFIRDGFAVRTT